jgi:glycosyltransferase involved in cell wall biosynthesis
MQDKNPLVTVGIPTYNRPAGLARTLDLITKQSYPNLEIIVSDNASTDPEVKVVLERYRTMDKRVSFFIQRENKSIVPNFRFVLEKATGKYFVWAADDDEWDLNFIESCVNGFSQHPDAVACITDVKIISLDGKSSSSVITDGYTNKNLYARLFKWVRARGETRYFFCGLLKTEVAKSSHFPNDWGGDQMFLLEMITKGRFVYIAGQSNFYYHRGGSSTEVSRIKKAFGIKNRFYYPESYVFAYAYHHFRFHHLNFFQKILLFFVNSTALILNKEFLLYYALIKKPVKNLINFFRKKRSS